MEGVKKMYVGIESSLQISKAWEQKRSMKRACCGFPSSMRIDFRGLTFSSTLINILVRMRVSSLTKAEMSTGGIDVYNVEANRECW